MVLLCANFCPLFLNNREHMLLAEEGFLLHRSPCFHVQNPNSLNIVAEFSFSLNSIANLFQPLFFTFLNQKDKRHRAPPPTYLSFSFFPAFLSTCRALSDYCFNPLFPSLTLELYIGNSGNESFSPSEEYPSLSHNSYGGFIRISVPFPVSDLSPI